MGATLLAIPGNGRALICTLEPLVKSSEQEFDQFFLANYDDVVNALTLITGDRDRATDAAQEAFVKAYAKWSKICSYDLPSAWVRRIAINISRDSHRSERRRRRRELPHRESDAVSPAEQIVGDDAARRLLGGLPPRQREVATLFYVDDRGVADIAAILGLSEGTVKSHLADARDGMRASFDRDGAER
ncbi:MAG: SigE family RNA polymerase sigma factor [Actinobacteria bacterium]|nr:MAG: SigE family RNA polymerase sigma factor [Actinomycetota bacterium]